MFTYEILTNEGEARQYGFCKIIDMQGTKIAYRDCKTNEVNITDAQDIKLQPILA